MTGMIWGTAILGHLHILGIIMIQPAIPGRTLLVLNTAQVWGVNSKIVVVTWFHHRKLGKNGPQNFKTVGLVAMNQTHGETWFLHCVYCQIQTCLLYPLVIKHGNAKLKFLFKFDNHAKHVDIFLSIQFKSM